MIEEDAEVGQELVQPIDLPEEVDLKNQVQPVDLPDEEVIEDNTPFNLAIEGADEASFIDDVDREQASLTGVEVDTENVSSEQDMERLFNSIGVYEDDAAEIDAGMNPAQREATIAAQEAIGTKPDGDFGEDSNAALSSYLERRGVDKRVIDMIPSLASLTHEDSGLKENLEAVASNVEKEVPKDTVPTRAQSFNIDIGTHAEGDHGDTPQPTNDAKEKGLPEFNKTMDIGFGHKVQDSEWASNEIHGIPFRNEDGSYIPLTLEQKELIADTDMNKQLDTARSLSWDDKLDDINSKWEDIDEKYQLALASLAYNVGGGRASEDWELVLKAAVDASKENATDSDIDYFAKHMRRKDSGKNTKGMDNRVLKELYFAGIISNVDEVAAQLPLGTWSP